MSILGLTGNTRTHQSIFNFQLDVAGRGACLIASRCSPFDSVVGVVSTPPILLIATAVSNGVIGPTSNFDHVIIDIYVGSQGATNFNGAHTSGTCHYIAVIPNGSYTSTGTLTITTTAEQILNFGTDPITLRTYAALDEITRGTITLSFDWNGTHVAVLDAPLTYTSLSDWAYALGASMQVSFFGATPGGSPPPGTSVPNDGAQYYPGIPGSMHCYFRPTTPYSVGTAYSTTTDTTRNRLTGGPIKIGTYTLDFTSGIDVTVTALAVYYTDSSGNNTWTPTQGNGINFNSVAINLFNYYEKRTPLQLKGEYHGFQSLSGLNPRTQYYGSDINVIGPAGVDGDSPSVSFTQKRVTCSAAGLVQGYQPFYVLPDTAIILSRSGDTFSDQTMGRLMNWNVFTLVHASTFNLPTGTWSATGSYSVTVGGIITPTLTGNHADYTFALFNMEAYRYLKIPITCTAAGTQTFKVTINGKVWSKSVTSATTFVEVDLCAPDGIPDTLLGQDSRWPTVQDGAIPQYTWPPRDETGHWGINRTTKVTFSDYSTVDPMTIGTMQMFRKSDPIFEGVKEYLATHTRYVTAGGVPLSSDSRCGTVVVDGRLALEFDTGSFLDYVSSTPGFTMTLAADPAIYAVENNPIYKTSLQYPRALQGGYYNHSTGNFVDTSRVVMTGGSYTGVASIAFQELRAHPGCGDPMTGTNYGNFTTGKGVLPFVGYIRGKLWGIAFSGGVPASGLGITINQISTGAAMGTATTDATGYWESGLPYGRHGFLYSVNGSGSITMIGRRRNRAAAIATSGAWHSCKDRQFAHIFSVKTSGTGALTVNRYNIRSGEDTNHPAYSGSATSAQIAWKPNDQLVILFTDTGAVSTIRSWSKSGDGGWTNPVTITTGLNQAIAIDEKHDIEYYAIFTGTTWDLWRLMPNGTPTFIATIATCSTNVQAGLVVASDIGDTLVFTYNDAGTDKRIVSVNYGATFN